MSRTFLRIGAVKNGGTDCRAPNGARNDGTSGLQSFILCHSFVLRTQNDKPVTYFRFHFCNVRYSASIFCFYANGLLYRCKRCLCF